MSFPITVQQGRDLLNTLKLATGQSTFDIESDGKVNRLEVIRFLDSAGDRDGRFTFADVQKFPPTHLIALATQLKKWGGSPTAFYTGHLNWSSQDYARAILEKPELVAFLPDKLKKNNRFIRSLLKENGSLWCYLPPHQKAFADFIYLALTSEIPYAGPDLLDAVQRLKNPEDFLKIFFASESFSKLNLPFHPVLDSKRLWDYALNQNPTWLVNLPEKFWREPGELKPRLFEAIQRVPKLITSDRIQAPEDLFVELYEEALKKDPTIFNLDLNVLEKKYVPYLKKKSMDSMADAVFLCWPLMEHLKFAETEVWKKVLERLAKQGITFPFSVATYTEFLAGIKKYRIEKPIQSPASIAQYTLPHLAAQVKENWLILKDKAFTREERERIWKEVVRQLNEEGVSFPFRIDTLKDFFKGLESRGIDFPERIHRIENISKVLINREASEDARPVLLALYPTIDHNDCFEQSVGETNLTPLDLFIENGFFRVIYYESSSKYQDADYIEKVTDHFKNPVHTVLFVNHSRAKVMIRGNGLTNRNFIEAEDLNPLRTSRIQTAIARGVTKQIILYRMFPH